MESAAITAEPRGVVRESSEGGGRQGGKGETQNGQMDPPTGEGNYGSQGAVSTKEQLPATKEDPATDRPPRLSKKEVGSAGEGDRIVDGAASEGAGDTTSLPSSQVGS